MGDEREKKSWREIDKLREKKREGGRGDSSDRERDRLAKSAAYSKYKQNLDSLFTPGGRELPEALKAKLGPASPEAEEKRKLLDALRANPSAETLRACNEREVALPDDPRLLLALLDVKEERLLLPVLSRLSALVAEGKKPSRMLLLAKLDALKHRASDEEVLAAASVLREDLGA